jgi:hypothetical protein
MIEIARNIFSVTQKAFNIWIEGIQILVNYQSDIQDWQGVIFWEDGSSESFSI